MSGCQKKNRNYMKELRCLIEKIQCTQMEPEVCNMTCPPLGCPRGPCPGLCRDNRGCVDPCCFSKMPNECPASSGCKSSSSSSHRQSHSQAVSCCGHSSNKRH